jgi:hypothetical protein
MKRVRRAEGSKFRRDGWSRLDEYVIEDGLVLNLYRIEQVMNYPGHHRGSCS